MGERQRMTKTRRAAAVVLGLIAGAAAIGATTSWGYYDLFSRFSWYDDEGYVMMSVSQVLEGRPLYDEVFSQYGPFYYVVRVVLLVLLQAPVSHDVTRLITLATWITAAALCGLYLLRSGKSVVVALAGY